MRKYYEMIRNTQNTILLSIISVVFIILLVAILIINIFDLQYHSNKLPKYVINDILDINSIGEN